MTRYAFLGDVDSRVDDNAGNPAANRRVRFYADAGKVTEYTDLASDASGTGSPLTVLSNAYGYAPMVYLPDGVDGTDAHPVYVGAVDSAGNPPSYVARVYSHQAGGGGGAVASVFGRSGAVVAQSGDYTAAQVGAVPTARQVAGHALSADVTLVKADVGLGNVDNTSDANKPVSTAQAAADALNIPLTQKAAANGVATLDGTGKVPQAQMPAVALTDFLGAVASQVAMLALTGQRGDWCTRTDRGTDWQLIADDPTQLANWREHVYPASPVSSVNGRTGPVTGLAESDLSNVDAATARAALNLGSAALQPTSAFDAAGAATTAATAVRGLPVALTGATQPTRYVGRWAATGAPASGTFAVGDFGFDGANTVQLCTVAGTPGTWVGTGASGAVVEPTTAPPSTNTTGSVLGTGTTAAHSDHTHAIGSHDHSTVAKGGQITPSAGLAATGTPSASTYLRGDNTWGTPAGGTGATLLTRVDYQPLTTATHYSTTSTSFVAVDTTNLRATFTAPASGKVSVRIVVTVATATSITGNIGILDGATVKDAAFQAIYNQATTFVVSMVFYMTGLTPGNSYSWDLAFASGNGGSAIHLYAGGAVGGLGRNPAIMEVWSA